MATRISSPGMVVGPHPDVADAGFEILKAGGNAIDAAVAAAFTVGVVEPANTGIAGYGGCAVAYVKELDRCISVNFDSRAPARSTEDMFEILESRDGTYRVKDRANLFGPLSVGVPAVLAGLTYLLSRYGRKSLHDVTRRAIAAAKDGFRVNRGTSTGIADVVSPLRDDFHETAKLVLPGGNVPNHGDLLRFPELAETLSAIATGGPEIFYGGELGDRVVEYLNGEGGIIGLDDLRRYEPIESRPLQITYRGHQILTPPLCSGGLTTLQMLKVLEGFHISRHAPGGPESYHLLVEVMKASWKERLSKYGDPDHISIDERSELAPGVVERLAAAVREGLAHPGRGEVISPDSTSCTSHVCASDAEGNFVSLTLTHGNSLGSLVSVPGTGLILGHGVARFDPRPGRPNSIGPRKQPLHNMSPILVMKDGEPLLVIGAPGGRTIVNNMTYFIAGLVDFELSPEETLGLPRCHVESIEPVQLETRAPAYVFSEMRKIGHEVTGVERIGGPAHAIMKRQGELIGATDPRDEGKVAG